MQHMAKNDHLTLHGRQKRCITTGPESVIAGHRHSGLKRPSVLRASVPPAQRVVTYLD